MSRRFILCVLLLCAAWVGLRPAARAADEDPLLPPPTDPLLDLATVLQPAATERMTAFLLAARVKGVSVYLLTLPTLRVLPSKQLEHLEALGKRYAAAWTQSAVGAVVIFDDEGGLMTVAFSEEAERLFSGLALEIALKEPMQKIQREGLAREKLEKSTIAVADALLRFHAEYLRDRRRQLIVNCLMGVVAVLGLGLALWSATRGGGDDFAATLDNPETGTKPPAGN